jgi:putative transposase
MSDHEFVPRSNRKRPVHQPVFESGNRAVIVFVTVCTKNRLPLLATKVMHDSIVTCWTKASHWLVGRYVILPDHIHLFCAPGTYPPESLLNWVRFWKALVSKSIGQGAASLWVKNFWDTQLRHKMVSRAEDWPYQGELNLLSWHD